MRPANELPPEILSRIARCLLGGGARDAVSIIPLTHVCQHWRESIILAPENWTLISNDRIELATLSLERAKTARLDVTIGLHQFRAGGGDFDLIGPYSKEIDTLRVSDLSSIEELTGVLPDFPQSSPNLRSLTLLCAYSNTKWDQSVDPFKSLAPTLKCLSLSNIPLYPSLRNLRSLTDLTLCYHWFDLHVDTLLDFLEHNRSLESANLDIRFSGPSLRKSRRRTAIENHLQHLSISCWDAATARTVASSIPLQRGAHLEITFRHEDVGPALNDILSGLSVSHLSNPPSPTFMEYQTSPREIRLTGPNGSFSYSHDRSPGSPFAELPILPLTNVQEIRLVHNNPSNMFHPTSFPALEALVIRCDTNISPLFVALFPNPSFFRSLKTLGFLDCVITEEFMEELTRFASDRKKTTSAWLHRVLITHRDGEFPSGASVRELGKHVPVVDVRFGTKVPRDLT